MSDSESFIEEVNEELRRDQLFAAFRKWGWIPVLLVLLLVGGAAWREYTRAQSTAQAQAFGDELVAALDQPDGAERGARLAAITGQDAAAERLLALLLAAEQADSGEAEAAAAGLRALAGEEGLAPRYRDLALLKAHLLHPAEGEAALRELEVLANPGAPFRPLALEQMALYHAAQGDDARAIEILRGLEEDAQATPGLQQRASQLIVALESGAQLQDGAAPEADLEAEAATAPEAEAATQETAPEAAAQE